MCQIKLSDAAQKPMVGRGEIMTGKSKMENGALDRNTNDEPLLDEDEITEINIGFSGSANETIDNSGDSDEGFDIIKKLKPTIEKIKEFISEGINITKTQLTEWGKSLREIVG